MYWQQYTPYILPLLLAAIISVGLAVAVWQRRLGAGGRALILILFMVALWSVAYILELIGTTLESKLFWIDVQYIAIGVIPAVWLVLAVYFTRRESWLRPGFLLLLTVEPILATTLIWTNDSHGLFRTAVALDTTGSFPVLVSERGLLFWLHTGYAYVLLLAGSVLLLEMVIRYRKLYRGQALALLVAAVAPWISNLAFLTGASPVDPTPVAFAISGLALTWGIFRSRLLDIVPVARDTVVENMGDGVIVLDNRSRVVDVNPAALRFDPNAGQALGQLLAEALPGIAQHVRSSDMPVEAVLETPKGRLSLEIVHTVLPNRRGSLLVLKDVTHYKRVEAALQRQLRETMLLNRVIATASSALEARDVLNIICREMAEALNLPQAAIGLLEDDGETLTIVAEYLAPGRPSAQGVQISIEENAATRQVIETGVSVLIPDMRTDSRLSEAMHEEAVRRGTVTLLLVPLVIRDLVIGTLGLDSTERREFTPEEITLAQNVAVTASQALERARLYETLQAELAERKRAQDKLAEANEELAEASRLKSHFLANMSHELRTPLNSILGYADMLGKGIYGDLNAKQSDRLEKVSRNGRLLLQLINDILDLSKIEAGKMELEITPLPLEPVVETCVSTMGSLAERKGLQLRADIDSMPPVLADEGRLQQVFTNLVGNAIKFTMAGSVTITARYTDGDAEVELPPGAAAVPHPACLITVADTGIGIAPEQQEAIFDEFRQGDSSFTREYEGTGLGLAITQRLVMMMQGAIWVESAVGEGSRFYVLLPLA